MSVPSTHSGVVSASKNNYRVSSAVPSGIARPLTGAASKQRKSVLGGGEEEEFIQIDEADDSFDDGTGGGDGKMNSRAVSQ